MHELATLFVAILVEESGIPIPVPGDTLVTLAGTQAPHTIGHALAVVGVSSLAIFLGSSLLFTVVHRGGRPLLTKYGKYVLLNEQRLARMERWFASRGRIGIIVGRLIPGLRIPTTIMAGLSGVAYFEFALTMALTAVVWSAFYYILGSVLGRTAPVVLALIADVLDYVPRWFIVVSILILLAYLGAAGTALKIRQVRLRRLRRPRLPRHLRPFRQLRQEGSSALPSLRSQFLGRRSLTALRYGRYTTMTTMNDSAHPVRDFPKGLPIYDNQDQELGTVSALGVQSTYLLMRTGRIVHHHVSIPLSAIQRSDGQGIYLNRTREEIHNLTLGGWSSLGNVDLNTGARASDDNDAALDPAANVASGDNSSSDATPKSEPAVAAVPATRDEVRTN